MKVLATVRNRSDGVTQLIRTPRGNYQLQHWHKRNGIALVDVVPLQKAEFYDLLKAMFDETGINLGVVDGENEERGVEAERGSVEECSTEPCDARCGSVKEGSD